MLTDPDQRQSGRVEPLHLLHLLLGRCLLADLNAGIDEFLGHRGPMAAVLPGELHHGGAPLVPRDDLFDLLGSQGLLVLPQPGPTRGFGWRWCRGTTGIPGREVSDDLADP